MSEGDSDFRVRPGRIKATRAPKAKSFLNQVLRAAKKAGHTGAPALGRRASGYGRSTFGRGRGSFSPSRLFSSTRRVVVKAVRAGTRARNQMEASVEQNQPALSSVYNLLVAAVNDLKASPAADPIFTGGSR